VQPAQPPDVADQQVVLDDPPVLGSVDADDLVIAELHPFGPVLGLAELEVGDAFGTDHRLGHAQRDYAVNRPAAAGELAVGVLDGDLVAEEPRRARAGVGDQRLVLVEFQLEITAQELGLALPDLLRLGFWPGEPEEVVSGRGGVSPPGPRRVKSTADEVPLGRVLFRRSLPEQGLQ
jgi:hypothetical protein